MTPCPGDHAPEDAPDANCQDSLYTLSEKVLQLDIPAPLDVDADTFLRLVGLLNEESDRGAFASGDSLSRSEAISPHKLRDQSSGRLAAPIRGPSARSVGIAAVKALLIR